jgi:hypothetical protein
MSRTSMSLLALVLIGFAVALLTYATRDSSGNSNTSSSTATIAQATPAQLEAAGLGKLGLRPESERVDVVAPKFSNPTNITNPLFPIGTLHSAILSGTVDEKPFHTQTSLLPETRIIEWTEGQQVETLVSQYVAYLDGRIEEVALDYYAQADDGSVWYFGEDVFNYKDGYIADTDGTWLAGKDGPPAMIMPGDPKVGDVYRPENVPGLVFEEVRVKAVDQRVAGSHGPVEGAIIAGELHQDGSREDKTFAPGYGEFFTGSGGDAEAMALAVPTDALQEPAPADLEVLSAGADKTLDAVRSKDWKAATATTEALDAAWESYRAGTVSSRLATEMSRALDSLARAIDAHRQADAATAAIDVAQSALDFKLRHQPPAEIDRARFELWARQLQVDAAVRDAAGVRGDLAAMEWIRDRFATTLDTLDLMRLDHQIVVLRATVSDEDLRGAAVGAGRLRDTLARVEAKG